MEREMERRGETLSFLDRATDLVVRVWARPLEGRAIRLRLAISAPMPPSWCEALDAVCFRVGDRSVNYRVKSYEPNGSMISFELEPASAEDAARADAIIEKRRGYFTNIERIELEIRNAKRTSFANQLYLPKT